MLVHLSIPSQDKTYDIDPDTLSYAEIEAMEDETDMTWGEMSVGLMRFSIRAVKVILWIAMRRENPRLRFDDVAFEPSDFEFQTEGQTAEAKPNRAQRRAAGPKGEASSSPSAAPITSGS